MPSSGQQRRQDVVTNGRVRLLGQRPEKAGKLISVEETLPLGFPERLDSRCRVLLPGYAHVVHQWLSPPPSVELLFILRASDQSPKAEATG